MDGPSNNPNASELLALLSVAVLLLVVFSTSSSPPDDEWKLELLLFITTVLVVDFFFVLERLLLDKDALFVFPDTADAKLPSLLLLSPTDEDDTADEAFNAAAG